MDEGTEFFFFFEKDELFPLTGKDRRLCVRLVPEKGGFPTPSVLRPLNAHMRLPFSLSGIFT
jgi:hypothetical protein